MFCENRLVFRDFPRSDVENLQSLSSKPIGVGGYLRSLIAEIDESVNFDDRSDQLAYLSDHLNQEAMDYLRGLEDLELDLECDDSYFNNLARLYSKVFGDIYLNFESGSTVFLNLETLNNLTARRTVSNFASVMAFDERGKIIRRFREGTVFQSLREFRVTNIGTNKVLLEKVVLPGGGMGFVPMFAMVDLGLDSTSLEIASAVTIDADFDFSSMLHTQFRRNFGQRVVSHRGLSLHTALGAGWVETVSDMNVRSLEGEVLQQVDAGTRVEYTGVSQVFLVNGLPLEFLEVEYDTVDGVVKGFVCGLGVSAAKSLDLLPFIDTRFSLKVSEYPSDEEVSDLRTTGLDIKLPVSLRNEGMVLGYSNKYNEYFLYSTRHTLKIAGETMRYLRYRKDYLDENHDREFSSFVRKHGDIRGKNGFEFEFESLDDLVHENIFDSMCLRTINDLANEVSGDIKHTLLVSLINNHHLRFLDEDDQVVNPMDLLEELREYDLVSVDRRNLDDMLYMTLLNTENSEPEVDTNADMQSDITNRELRALIV